MSEMFIVQFRCDNFTAGDHCKILGVYDSLELAKEKSVHFMFKNIDLDIKIQINKWSLNESMKDQYEVWSFIIKLYIKKQYFKVIVLQIKYTIIYLILLNYRS